MLRNYGGAGCELICLSVICDHCPMILDTWLMRNSLCKMPFLLLQVTCPCHVADMHSYHIRDQRRQIKRKYHETQDLFDKVVVGRGS